MNLKNFKHFFITDDVIDIKPSSESIVPSIEFFDGISIPGIFFTDEYWRGYYNTFQYYDTIHIYRGWHMSSCVLSPVPLDNTHDLITIAISSKHCNAFFKALCEMNDRNIRYITTKNLGFDSCGCITYDYLLAIAKSPIYAYPMNKHHVRISPYIEGKFDRKFNPNPSERKFTHVIALSNWAIGHGFKTISF